MRILIIGSVASGKSTFAVKVGNLTSLPVIHLDNIIEKSGCQNKQLIKLRIEEEINKESWIIDGNAFTKDKNRRIETCDLIFYFKQNIFISYFKHIKRYILKESPKGCMKYKFNIYFDTRYILFHYPKLIKGMITLAKESGKKIITFRNSSEANNYLELKKNEYIKLNSAANTLYK